MSNKYSYNSEYVLPEDLFRFLDKAFPSGNTSEMARTLGVNDKRIYALREQEAIGFYTADRLLSKLELSYLLSSGDIPVYSKPLTENHKKYYRPRRKAYLDTVPSA